MTALANGTQLGRYEIRSENGAGGMGELLEQAWEERKGQSDLSQTSCPTHSGTRGRSARCRPAVAHRVARVIEGENQ